MAQNHGFLGSEIRDKTKRCEERFNACLAHPDVEKYKCLEMSSSDFNCWSSSLNASHSGRSSLDYKIRQRPDIIEIITDLLESLEDSLEEYLDDSLEECSDSDDDSVSVADTEENSEDSLHYKVFNIKMILKHLKLIQIVIRKFGTQIRHGKADASLGSILNNNVNGLKTFADDMTEAVLAGFENRKSKEDLPKPWANVNMQLLDRLVNANTRRRNRIFFETEKMRKAKEKEKDCELKNKEKLAMVDHPVLELGTAEETSKLERIPDAIPDVEDSAKEFPVAPLYQHGKPTGGSEAPTAATTFPSEAIFEQALSKVAGTTISRATGTTREITYPLPPKWPEDPKILHMDCPYCSEPLAREHLKQATWNGHVSGDILPYICFFEDCKTPDDLYRTCDELTEHVISDHGVPCWICHICTSDIEQEQFEIFESAQSWGEHMRQAHPRCISDMEFPRLAEKAMRKMVPPLQCPLCDYATFEIKPNIDPEIARHIHEFSIRSLPWGTRAE